MNSNFVPMSVEDILPTKYLKKYSPEWAQEMKTVYSIDVEKELAEILKQEILKELEKKKT